MSSIGMGTVNAAYPALASALDVSPAVIAWVGILYTLVNASLITTFGRLSDLRGRRRVYAVGLAIVSIGGVLCGLSGDVTSLLAARAFQGIGSAMVTANSVAYLLEIYPPSRRGFVVGWWEVCISIGLGAGPALGGLLLATWGWRSIFLAPVPFGLIILALIPRYMVEPARRAPRRAGFDLAGAGLFGVGVAALLFAATEGYDFGWTSVPIVACLVLAVACAVTFVRVELRVRDPMVHLSLFRSRGFSGGNLAKVCTYFGFSAHTFLLPFYLASALALQPTQLGVSLSALPVGMLVSSAISGPLSDRIGTRLLAPLGGLVLVVSAVLLTQVAPSAGVAAVVGAMLLGGVGIGTFIAPNDSAILAATPRDRLGVANGIMSVSRSLGIVLGQSIVAGLLSAWLASTGDFLTAFHQTYVVVALVAVGATALAAMRDRKTPPPPGGSAAA